MSKDAYYFSHDANARNDPKVVTLRLNMGWEGYGLYWALLEICRDNNTGENPFKLETKCLNQMVMMLLNIEKTKALTLISTLKVAGLFIEENGHFYSESFVNRMVLMEEKRHKLRQNGKLGGRPTNKPKGYPDGLANGKQNESSKVKESKVKERNNGKQLLSSKQQEGFDLFYDAYGKKIAPNDAKKAWKKISPELYDKIILSAEKANRSNHDKQYQKNPSTWLNGGCWDDEIITTVIEKQDEEPEYSQDEIMKLFSGDEEYDQ